jgi:hypothetical protein
MLTEQTVAAALCMQGKVTAVSSMPNLDVNGGPYIDLCLYDIHECPALVHIVLDVR